MPHIADLTPGPGERHGIFGGTRAGKSAFQDMSLRHIQATRPEAMQILVDTKPRFRAEYEKGLRPNWRKSAAHRYTDWSKGPIVPNSVVVDLRSDRPFAGTFNEPGEIVILQSGEGADWRRILELLDGFVKANVGGRERRIVVDECLDFTSAILGESTPRMTFSFAPLELEANGTSELILAHTKSRDCRNSLVRCSLASPYFTCGTTKPICNTCTISASQMKHRQRVITFSDSGQCSRAERYRRHSLEPSNCQNRTYRSSRQHKEG